MNGLKYAVLSLAVLACFDGSAKRKNKKAKKAETVRVDTCSVDTFSYAMGMANTQGLKNYVTSRMNVDTAYMANFIEVLTLRSRKPNAKSCRHTVPDCRFVSK